MRSLITWTAALVALLALAGLIFAVTTAHAEITVVGHTTVSEYLQWPSPVQTGYVAGVMGTLTYSGLKCKNPGTVRVMMSWLSSPFADSSDNIVNAIAQLSINKHGCYWPEDGKPGV